MIKRLLFGGDGGGSKIADVGLLLLRVFAGISMAYAHGWGKVTNPAGVIGGATKMGFPMPTFFGWAAAFAEFVGSLLLIIGLATRPAAFLVASTMFVAFFMFHANDVYKVKELAAVYLAIMVCFMFTGSGRYGVDPLLRGRSRHH